MGNCVGGKGSKKDPTILTEEEIKLLLDNTKLSRHQIVALHHNFLKECPSGKLTKKDFIKLFKEVHPSENKKEKADKFCEYVFKVIDHHNLGYISFQDFVLCFSLTSYGDFKQKCEFAFKLYDLDRDGKISKKEMTQVLEALYDLSGITDRKGDKAPAKIVEDIIKKLNQQQPAPVVEAPAAAESAPAAEVPKEEAAPAQAAEAPKEEVAEVPAEAEQQKEAPAAEAPKDSKKDKKDKKDKGNKDKKPKERAAKESKPKAEAKPAKPAKAAKQPDYITKEQFIDACNNDEAIKKLFVDSIFASQAEANDEVVDLKPLGDAEPNIVVETNTTLDSDQNKDVVTNTVTVDLHDQAASESTIVVNRSEVVISELEPEQTNNSEQQPDKTPVAEINQVVEEINNEAKVELAPISNETESEQQQVQNPPQQVEENSTDNNNAQPKEQPKPAAEASQSNEAEAK